MEHKSRKELDNEFQEYYLSSSVPSMKVGLTVTLLLFISYAAINRILFADSIEQQYFFRFGLIVPTLAVSMAVLFIKPLKKYLALIFILVNLFSCLAIYYVGVTSDITSRGYNYYYAWVMLVVIGMHTFYRIRFRDLIILNALQFMAYFSATLVNHSYSISFLYFNHLFFVVSVTTLGFFISYIFQSLNWKNFLHQKALTENYHRLIQEVKERKEAQDELATSERQYHEALDSFPDWVIAVDRDMNIKMVNSTLKQVAAEAGLPGNLIGMNIERSFPFINKEEIDNVRAVFETGRISIGELSFEFVGQQVFVETRTLPMIRNNRVEQVMVVTRDRSREREIEALKLKNAETKETMLKEIHHRVKNNLAIVISLLSMQGSKNNDPEFQKLIRDIELRIRSMALIHEHLYRSENFDKIPLSNYIQSLVSMISSTFSGHKISLKMELKEILVNIETALPLGLITNELLTNAYKYAYPGMNEGIVSLKLETVDPNGFRLTVSDNGIGLPEGFDLRNQETLGMFIIRLLIEQLDGSISITSKGGVSACITVPDFKFIN
ncbi:MAG: histidine kinase dimerization/phosphoacceptor domain -containing protein [Bacteroidota bacterium]|jgi:two-component sensor histidine kinase